MKKVPPTYTAECRFIASRRDLMRTLPEREQRIVTMRADGRTRAEIAQALGVTNQRAHNLEQQARQRAHTAIKDTPLGFYRYERFGP